MNFSNKFKFCLTFLFAILMVLAACKKIVQIDPPASSIVTSEVFKDSIDANAATLGIYSQMINTGNPLITSGALTIYGGLSSDELINFQSSDIFDQVYTNALQSSNQGTYYDLWTKAYSLIYQTNANIEGLEASAGLTQAARDQFEGEAKFLRAFCYFYLVNLFGDVPYVTSTAWSKTSIISRSSAKDVYNAITSDLIDAQNHLRSDYNMSRGERIRANSFVATAMLARVYLYRKIYDSAEIQATNVIDNPVYSLDSNLNDVFLVNSTESILQLGLNPGTSGYGNLTPEGYALVPGSPDTYPNFYLTPQLLNSFEDGDKRKISWIDSSEFSGTVYYYPYKYKLGGAQYNTDPATEYYTLLRLAEQYLIRAEARANLNKLADAIDDINVIRIRAGLAKLSYGLTQADVLSAVMQERKIELVCEWGHRWLDLKRTGAVDSVMTIVTPQKNGGSTWNNYQQLYPIPADEMKIEPNLTQNPGY